MNYDTVRTMLDTQLTTAIGDLPLQNENTRYTPKNGVPYVRSQLLPAEANAIGVGPNGMDEHQGLYQVDVFYPQDYGTADANAMAALVMAALPRGYIATSGSDNVHVVKAWQQVAYQQGSSYCVPVMVRWTSYHSASA
jgi:hypothetical protein